MTLLPNLLALKAPLRDRLPSASPGSLGGMGLTQMTTTSSQVSAMQMYGANPTLYAISTRVAEAVALADWELYRQPAKGAGRTLIDDMVPPARHPLTALWTAPNPFYTGMELRKLSQLYKELTGEAWIAVLRGMGGAPVELWPIRPDRMAPVRSPDKYILGYIYTFGTERVPLEVEDVIFMPSRNPMDPYRGIGPAQAAMTDLEGDRDASIYNRNFFRNSARPGGIIQLANENLSDADWERMVLRWREQHQGVSNAHRVAVLERGTWVDASTSHVDMQFSQQRKDARDQMLLAYGMHASVMGISENVNRANAEAAEVSFSRWLVRPRLEDWKGAVNTRLVPAYGDDLTLDYIDPAPDDRAQATTEATDLWESGLATLNQCLERAGLPAWDGPEGNLRNPQPRTMKPIPGTQGVSLPPAPDTPAKGALAAAGRPFAVKALSDPPPALVAAMAAIVAYLLANARRLTDEEDDYSDSDFANDGHDHILVLILLAYALGAGISSISVEPAMDESALAAAARTWAMATAEQQRSFLAGFAADISAGRYGGVATTSNTGEVTVAALDDTALSARGDLYNGSTWSAYQRGTIEGAADEAPYGTIRWVTSGDEGVCAECAERDGEIYTQDELPGFPGDGDFGELCEGGPACRCFLEYIPPDVEAEPLTTPNESRAIGTIVAEARCPECRRKCGVNVNTGAELFCGRCKKTFEVTNG